jgi:AraC-like DNA-binding protein
MTAEPSLSAVSSRPDATIVSTETFTLVKVPPPVELQGLVLDIALYRETSGKPIRQIETASLVVPMLIGFAEPFEIALGREPTSDEGFHSFTSGLCLTPVNIASAGACSCLEITLTPLGARRFFGVPMSELRERMIHLDDLEDRSLLALRQALGNERDWDRRLALAESFLLQRMRNSATCSPGTAWAYHRILTDRGRTSVADLTAKLGWSRKHLAARFHEEIGLPPKAVARIARFTHAQSLARDGTETGWAGIAVASGYSDQAHLTREFSELAGISPAAWMSSLPH